MSVSDSWGRSDNGRRPADRGASEHPLAELADRLADARRSGEPAPEELERLVELLAKSDLEPGDRLTRALEGFARMSEERRGDARAERPAERQRQTFSSRAEEARYAPARSPVSDELEARLADFADTLPRGRSDERRDTGRRDEPLRRYAPEPRPAQAPEPRPQPKAAQTPPIASLRAALAEISERQKALDAEFETPARQSRQPEPRRPDYRAPEPRPSEPRRPILPQQEARRPEPASAEPRRAQPAPRAPERDYAAAPRPASAYGSAQPQPPAPDAAATTALKELRAELDRLGRSVTDLPTRAEIDRMTREMSELAKRLTDDRPARLDRDSLSAIDQLVAQVDRMRSDAPSPQVISKLSEEVHAITARLDVLGPRSSSAIDSLVRRIDDVRAELDQFPRISAVDGVAREIQTLISRLDAQEAVAAPTREAVVGLAGRVETLDGQIAAIAQATAARDEALERINATIRTELDSMPRADAVTDLGRQIDALTEGLKSRSAIGPALKAVEGLADKVEALDDKIAAIASFREEEAGRLSDMMRDEFAAAARPEALEGIGRRIEALDDKLETLASRREADAGRLASLMRGELAAAVRPEAFEGLGRRIEALDDRIASIATRRQEETGWLTDALRDEISAVAQPDRFDGLSRQIAALTDRLSEERRAPVTVGVDALTTRIDDLGDRFDTMAAATRARGAAFEQVEESIRAIAERLIDVRSPSTSDLSGLETEVVRLVESLGQNEGRIEDLHHAFAGLAGRIERSCADLGAHAVETAVAAARDVLGSETGAGGGRLETELAEALSELRASAAHSERRAADTLDAVRSTLERLLDRMEHMPEQTQAQAEAPVPAYRQFRREPEPQLENATEIARAAAMRAMEEIADSPHGAPGREPYVDEPTFRPYGEFGPDHPLEPGAGLHRGESQAAQPSPSSAASLIASARRAQMQSAVDPIAEPQKTEPASKRASLFGGALSALKKSKRPMLFGVAALVIVFTALYVASGMTGDAEQAAPPPPAPQSRLAPAQEPRIGSTDARVDAKSAELAEPSDADVEEFASAEDAVPEPSSAAAPEKRPEAPAAADAAPAPEPEPKTTAAASAPRAPARDLTNFAFAEAGAAAKTRADWKLAEPSTTGSIKRDANGLPDAIGGQTLKSRAASGDPAAELEVGDRLLDGRNVTADPVAAVRWFEKAAAQGSAPAQHRLGSLYEKGRGVPRDVAAARRWYEQAAASGNVRAMHNLGVVHAEGGLGKPDYAAAMVWFRMAAERGLNDSGYNLAVLAARGLGGKRDLVEAYKWFALAAADGDDDAAKKRDEVGKALGSSITVAKAAVASFKPKPVDPAANDPQTPAGGWDRVAARANASDAGSVAR